ncbi:diphosphomevalonate/mevalonate 3,5-bisphosphate decarboxylase family protein [Flagellimonas algicola]|uniref:Diphosphomevalonate decarboxylase n=1 Tax=Flagellimonas algicola TaxID=2583815 RepID=A0ABY2WLS7_9FLAO|nr:diphosphomevalonate decarboxylase [Allomuricauda algicola]TMU55486.1 diphosphomevalonate decarboxylase [Allomuricauda algicola]
MTEKDFLPKHTEALPESGKVAWKAPSNIALVKYWGKKENQIPANPSISFTLDACATRTTLSFQKKETTSKFSFDLYLDGKPKADFKPKIEVFFDRIAEYVPFVKEYHFVIETSNSFPHSSGIASSASGMSALALCLMDLERHMQPNMDPSFFMRKASFLARLGSGSACRSLEGDLVVWGKHESIEGSSNLFGLKYPYKVHDNFKHYHDTILLVDKGEKQVSSTVGHNLMHGHPFAEERFKQAYHNLTSLQTILESGDLEEFVKVVESEALTLHAMMMSSNPYFILMKPNTLEIINKIWGFRKETGMPVCFTLDAGANVHVLYPESIKDSVIQFIQDELVAHCDNGHYICDRIGTGAKELIIPKK